MNIYERMFRMDLAMLKVRQDINKNYERFCNFWEGIKIDNEKDYSIYQKSKERMMKYAWFVDDKPKRRRSK